MQDGLNPFQAPLGGAGQRLTRGLLKTMQERAQRDELFRLALLIETLKLSIARDVEIGNALLLAYLKAYL
jgi:hypothetical protein